MKDFINDAEINNLSAVVLGKGPSYEGYKGGGGFECGINQVIRRRDLGLWIFAHIEVLWSCMDVIGDTKIIVAPYHPIYGEEGSQRMDLTFEEHVGPDFLETHGDRIYLYNAPWQNVRYGGSKQVVGTGTTAHHLVHLLAMKGVKHFDFYGVDGGRKVYGKKYYADGFDHDPKKYFEAGTVPADFDTMWVTYFELRRKYGLSYYFG